MSREPTIEAHKGDVVAMTSFCAMCQRELTATGLCSGCLQWPRHEETGRCCSCTMGGEPIVPDVVEAGRIGWYR